MILSPACVVETLRGTIRPMGASGFMFAATIPRTDARYLSENPQKIRSLK